MQCDHARNMMAEALDGEGAPELTEHLGRCQPCHDEWASLQAVEAMLRSQELMAPTAHFTSRVMGRLTADVRRVPDWRRSLMQVGAIVSGTLLVTIGAALLLRGWQLSVAGSASAASIGDGARAARMLADALLVVIGPQALAWPLYGALTVALVVTWFGVLVVPRLATRPAGAVR
jgi:predicted anti-sigma-YlaC factor YlaD